MDSTRNTFDEIDRRSFVGAAAMTVAAAGVSTLPGAPPAAAAADPNGIRPFHINVPQEQIVDLRRRIGATRWPDKETVTDASQGVQLATLQKLALYWQTEHDQRDRARLNALPQFMTVIDGLDIHFIHVRSKHDNALPLIVTHGWPGSIIEQIKIIEPLTDPTAHGGDASDAFHLVIPSLPGYGFSGKPTAPGWTPVTIARAWATLMQRLGYTRYVAQGGDWGNAVSEVMALQQPPGLLGIHTNMAATVPADVSKALATAAPPPAGPLGVLKSMRGMTRMISMTLVWLTPRKCRTGHRHFTESRIRRLASPGGWWIMTSAVTA